MKESVKSFHDLIVWQKAHNLVLQVYKDTASFPSEEKFGITSQIRRAAISVPANIVEGHARRSRKEFLNFLNIAHGSLEELKYLLLLSRELNYLDENEYSEYSMITTEVSKILYGFKKSLES
ncbi:MAG: four helix bundle protein [Melioribacteraceae bacterium]|nr:four helix bundle protein [Melioribacteraceae bacterium]MCF8263507.1 four helix bundle protein [Melioribacteraceae bacterium]